MLKGVFHKVPLAPKASIELNGTSTAPALGGLLPGFGLEGLRDTLSLLISHPSALPARFQEELQSKEVTEGGLASLRCNLSKAAPVEWMKGGKPLKPSEKYTMKQKDTVAELTVHDVTELDAGDYTCVCGDQKTSVSLTVHGKYYTHKHTHA